MHLFVDLLQESVLQLKREETLAEQSTDPANDPSVVHYNIPVQILQDVDSAQRKVESTILKFEPVIGHLEELWEVKVSFLKHVSCISFKSIFPEIIHFELSLKQLFFSVHIAFKACVFFSEICYIIF